MLDRRSCVAELLAGRDDLLVVTGLGAPTYDVAAAGDHPLNFYLWGAMGSAAMIGLGLALAKPKARIAVITGDGEMLMGLGSLATIGVKQPRNLSLVVLDNRHYGETGMQASHTNSGIDLVAIAKACRFAQARAVSMQTDIESARRLLHAGDGPNFLSLQVDAANHERVLPSRDGNEIKQRFTQALAKLS
ncbi:MAG TPA: thiamine pyrophosphate-dependent enzyme [Micropepsaceae bacterium]|nr:thiamine pyrophosphate-dependent enzyme [Micropepsaceae bacterium]